MSRYPKDVLAPGWQKAGKPTTTELPAEFGSTHAEFGELFGEMLARMNCTACHGVPHLE